MVESERLKERRAFRAREEVKTIIASSIAKRVEEKLEKGESRELIEKVVERKLDPYSASQIVMEKLKADLWG